MGESQVTDNLSFGHRAVRLTFDGVSVVLGVARLGGGVGADEGAGLAHRDGDLSRVHVGIVAALRVRDGAPDVVASQDCPNH